MRLRFIREGQFGPSREMNQVGTPHRVTTEPMIPDCLRIRGGVVESMGARPETDNRLSGFEIISDVSKLLIAQLEEAGIENPDIGVLQCLKPRKPSFVSLRIPIGIDQGCSKTEPLQLVCEHRHRLLWRVVMCPHNNNRMGFFIGIAEG